MIWFTSDWHLGHEAILWHQPERSKVFSCIEDMDAGIIEAANTVLRKGDELWHLGDFCWKASKAGHYRQRLRPGIQLHLVRGNHDAASLAKHCSSCEHMAFKVFEGYKFHLSHYPIWSWASRVHGGFHLYGHCHGMAEAELDVARPGRLSMDVGVEVAAGLLGAWRPFSLDEILGYLLPKVTT